MQLTQVITQANQNVKLEFCAMERSLRATGCDLPLRVIPFDEQRFDLPANAEWLDFGELGQQLTALATHPCHRRYGVLTLGNYQLTDVDVIFIRDPQDALRNISGFVATCTQWRLPRFTVTKETQPLFEASSSLWYLKAFCAGQFACEPVLYESAELLAAIRNKRYQNTLLMPSAPWDQPGFNLLVHLKQPPFTNLTLPPHSMESTMVSDYPGEYRPLWDASPNPPYLIHWAGPFIDQELPINELFFEFLTREELAVWKEQQQERQARRAAKYRQSLGRLARAQHDLKQTIKKIFPQLATWRNQPSPVHPPKVT